MIVMSKKRAAGLAGVALALAVLAAGITLDSGRLAWSGLAMLLLGAIVLLALVLNRLSVLLAVASEHGGVLRKLPGRLKQFDQSMGKRFTALRSVLRKSAEDRKGADATRKEELSGAMSDLRQMLLQFYQDTLVIGEAVDKNNADLRALGDQTLDRISEVSKGLRLPLSEMSLALNESLVERKLIIERLTPLLEMLGEFRLSPVIESAERIERAVADTQAALGEVLTGLAANASKSDVAVMLERAEALQADLGKVHDGGDAILAGVRGIEGHVGDFNASLKGMSKPIDALSAQIQSGTLHYPIVNDLAASLRLQAMFNPAVTAPQLTGWTVESAAISRLVDMVIARRPRLVVECGSGLSSIWLGYALRRVGGRLVALEHLEEYAQRTRDEIERHGLQDVVEIRSAPLVEVSASDRRQRWYDPAALEGLEDIELLLVDGPPKATGPLARYPALPMLEDRLAAEAVIIIDDAHREGEAESIALWRAHWTEMSEPVELGSRRMVAIEWSRGLEGRGNAG